MELLQPGSLVNLFFRSPGSAAAKAVEIIKTGEKLLRILHLVNTKLKFIHIARVKVDARLL